MATAAATTTPPTQPPEQSLREALGAVPPSEVVSFINLLVYGDPGCGKTYLSGTAADDPQTSPVLILDVEGGVTTLRGRSKNIEVVPIRSWVELNETYKKLYASQNSAKTLMPYKTIVIDSLTELAALD